MEVSTPSQARLSWEAGESGPLFLKSHQPFRERHPTPFAISSGYHFEKLSTHSSFLKTTFGRDLFDYFRMKRRYIAGNLFLIFFSESGNTVKSRGMPLEKEERV